MENLFGCLKEKEIILGRDTKGRKFIVLVFWAHSIQLVILLSQLEDPISVYNKILQL